MDKEIIEKLNVLIKGLEVISVKSFHDNEIVIEFRDKTRLFVNVKNEELDISVT